MCGTFRTRKAQRGQEEIFNRTYAGHTDIVPVPHIPVQVLEEPPECRTDRERQQIEPRMVRQKRMPRPSEAQRIHDYNEPEPQRHKRIALERRKPGEPCPGQNPPGHHNCKATPAPSREAAIRHALLPASAEDIRPHPPDKRRKAHDNECQHRDESPPGKRTSTVPEHFVTRAPILRDRGDCLNQRQGVGLAA